MGLVCSYKALAGQAKVPYFDIVDAIWANAYEYVVRLEIAVDNVQAFEHTELVVSRFPNENRDHIPVHVYQSLEYLTE